LLHSDVILQIQARWITNTDHDSSVGSFPVRKICWITFTTLSHLSVSGLSSRQAASLQFFRSSGLRPDGPGFLPLRSRPAALPISSSAGIESLILKGATNIGIGSPVDECSAKRLLYSSFSSLRSVWEGCDALPLDCLYQALRTRHASHSLSQLNRDSIVSPTSMVRCFLSAKIAR
jgi:hypothetical protein